MEPGNGHDFDADRIEGYPSVADLTVALGLVAAKRAYQPEPPLAYAGAPQPTNELRDWLISHRPLPHLQVRCVCTRRLGVWQVRGYHVEPLWSRPKRFGPTGAVEYTEAVAAGKGNIISSYTADALGPITYLCPKCGKNYPLRTETRMRLYLSALLLNSRDVILKPGKLI
jgi:hypothetical protein